jgi:hypothetical protein
MFSLFEEFFDFTKKLLLKIIGYASSPSPLLEFQDRSEPVEDDGKLRFITLCAEELV